MHLKPVSSNCNSFNYKTLKEPSFCAEKTKYSIGEKAIVASTTALGVCTALAGLAKGAGYSLKPNKILKDFKNSYLAKVHYEWPEVIAIGAGSCLGGLAGGYLIDKNKDNRKIKQREAIMHFGNISIPILTVGMVVDKVFKNSNKWVKAGAGLGGIIVGLYLANIITNKICNTIFNNKFRPRCYSCLTNFYAFLGVFSPRCGVNFYF